MRLRVIGATTSICRLLQISIAEAWVLDKLARKFACSDDIVTIGTGRNHPDGESIGDFAGNYPSFGRDFGPFARIRA